MNNRTLTFLLFSVVIHGLLFGGILGLSLNREAQTIIEVELKPQGNPVAQKKLVKKGSQARGGFADVKAQNSKVTKLDLGLSTLSAVMSNYQATPAAEGVGEDWKNPQNFTQNLIDQYEGMEMPEVKYVEALWGLIDRNLMTSDYLSEYGHTGRVFFKFEVDANGELDNSTIRVDAEDRVLKVLAARAIRKALSLENQPFTPPKGRTQIEARFAWSDYSSCRAWVGIQKHNLSFCRYAENKVKTFTKGEKALNYLGAIRYGFDAIDEIKKYQREEMHRNTNFDPFEELKRDPDWNLGS